MTDNSTKSAIYHSEIKDRKDKTQARIVWDALNPNGTLFPGMDAHEVVAKTGLKMNCVTRALNELCNERHLPLKAIYKVGKGTTGRNVKLFSQA